MQTKHAGILSNFLHKVSFRQSSSEKKIVVNYRSIFLIPHRKPLDIFWNSTENSKILLQYHPVSCMSQPSTRDWGGILPKTARFVESVGPVRAQSTTPFSHIQSWCISETPPIPTGVTVHISLNQLSPHSLNTS